MEVYEKMGHPHAAQKKHEIASKDILNIPENRIIGTLAGFSLQFGDHSIPVALENH